MGPYHELLNSYWGHISKVLVELDSLLLWNWLLLVFICEGLQLENVYGMRLDQSVFPHIRICQKVTLLQASGSFPLPGSLPHNFSSRLGVVWQAGNMFRKPSGGFLLQENTCHNSLVRWHDIRRYSCCPFIQVSLFVISLSQYFWIINPLYRMSPYFTFSVSIPVLLCPSAVLLVLRVKHTSQLSRLLSQKKVIRPLTHLPVLPIPFVFIWHSVWCRRTLVASIIIEFMCVVLISRASCYFLLLMKFVSIMRHQVPLVYFEWTNCFHTIFGVSNSKYSDRVLVSYEEQEF